jgi:ParB-like chromosome segregation protein Spo0J
MDWPADRVERRPLNELIPAARNSRTHSDEQVAQIAASIKEWGWTVPVLIDESGELIAGHGRVLAAKTLGLDTVPVMTATGWSDAKKRAYLIADNKLPLNAEWDSTLLKLELAELKKADFDLGLMGFDKHEIALMLKDVTAQDTSPQLTDMKYSVVVRCDDELHQTELLDRFETEGLKCQALIS